MLSIFWEKIITGRKREKTWFNIETQFVTDHAVLQEHGKMAKADPSPGLSKCYYSKSPWYNID